MFKAIINENHEFEVDQQGNNFSIGNTTFDIDLIKTSERNIHVLKNNRSFTIEILKKDQMEKFFLIRINGNDYRVNLKDSSDILLNKLGINSNHSEIALAIKAPMPGLILEILVAEGTEIKKGTPLLILEAMKMENVLKSPRDGVIKSILVVKGNSVEKNQILVKF